MFCDIEAQSPYFKHYTVENNLPSSECYQVLQDKMGYIWVATDKGVSKFDGYTFTDYTKEDGLPENCIIRMCSDQYGRIWFGGVSGKIAYFDNNEIKKLEINDEIEKKLNGGYINSMSFYKNELWIGTYSAAAFFKISFSSLKNNSKKLVNPRLVDLSSKVNYNGSFVCFLTNTQFIQGVISNDKKNVLYNDHLSFYYINNKKRIFNQNAFKNLIKRIYNVRATIYNEKEILFYFDNEIIKINRTSGKVTSSIKTTSQINYLYTDSKGGLWLGTNKNGLQYYPRGFYAKGKPITYLKGMSISGIEEDTEGGIWITTLEEGLYYLREQNFKHITALSSRKVNTIFFDNKMLFGGLDNGQLIIYDGQNVSEQSINPNNNEALNFIRKIVVLNKNVLAIGGSSGYCEHNLDTKITKWYTHVTPSSITKRARQSIVTFTDFKINQPIWLVTNTSIIEFTSSTKKKNSIRKYRKFHSKFYCAFQDEKGVLWLGASKGLFTFSKGKFTFRGGKSISLSNRINDLKIKNETIWTATKEYGVCIKKGDDLYYINSKKGLPSNICQSLFLESQNIGWIATNKGVSKIIVDKWKPFNIRIKNYSAKNGLLSNEVNEIVKHKSDVYVATNKGITIFNEKKIIKNTILPPIYITKILINKIPKSIKKRFSLPYHQNNIFINYTGLSYKNMGNIEYRYRLLGLDSNWVRTKYNKIPFNSLSYGHYTFEVEAKNSDGYWSRKPAVLHFIISPPFWHTWLFRSLSGLLFFGGIYWFVSFRIRTAEKRAEEKSKLYKQTLELEMKFLSSQMNPHFTFNAMNSIQYYLMENEPEKAQKYLLKYSKLIRKVLENNMKKYVPIKEETEMLSLYMDIESLRFEIQFDYEIKIPENIKALNISIPPMIIQPYIENAIWHGISNRKEVKGKILICFEMIDDKLKCTIEDNGIGRAKTKELKPVTSKKESLGMLITHQRLQHLHSALEMEIEPEIIDLHTGTRVVIYLPFIQKDISPKLAKRSFKHH